MNCIIGKSAGRKLQNDKRYSNLLYNAATPLPKAAFKVVQFPSVHTVTDDRARLLHFSFFLSLIAFTEKKLKRKMDKKTEVEIGSLSFKKVLIALPLLKRSIRFFMIIRVEFKPGRKSHLLDTISYKKIHNMLLIRQMYRFIDRFDQNVYKFISKSQN